MNLEELRALGPFQIGDYANIGQQPDSRESAGAEFLCDVRDGLVAFLANEMGDGPLTLAHLEMVREQTYHITSRIDVLMVTHMSWKVFAELGAWANDDAAERMRSVQGDETEPVALDVLDHVATGLILSLTQELENGLNGD